MVSFYPCAELGKNRYQPQTAPANTKSNKSTSESDAVVSIQLFGAKVTWPIFVYVLILFQPLFR
jgi:hypothetical protein